VNTESRSRELGFDDPASAPLLRYPPAFIEVLAAIVFGGLGTALMYVAAQHASDSRAIVVSIGGTTLLLSAVVIVIGTWRDVRAKDASRRIERRLERLIELQAQALAVQQRLVDLLERENVER
jgi:hypothetical protein